MADRIHADTIPLDMNVGWNCQAAADLGLLTDTTIAAADTNAGLQAAVTAAVVHADIVPSKARINQAIQVGLYDGSLTDAVVLGLTTVAGLVAATQAGTQPNRSQFID